MSDPAPRAVRRRLDDRRRTVMAATAIIALLVTVVGIRAVTRDDGADADAIRAGGSEGSTADRSGDGSDADGASEGGGQGPATTDGTADTASSADGSGDSGDPASPNARSAGSQAPSPARAAAGTPLPGVTDDEITVVYYWKGDRTRASPYLGGTGIEGNVDEADAFRKLIAFINANADGGATLMGQPIDLHGRKLEGIVVEAGQDAESYAAAAERITKELEPFAAVAAHGSISTYLCPTLAAAGIHNLATYDLAGGLVESSDGYCLPSGMTWEQQVDLTEGYLVREQRQNPKRVYGVVYAEYPGLVESAPAMVERYRRAGINVGEVASVSASLTTAQQQAPNVVARMRAKGVNAIVMPDAGAPLNFTHAAQSQGYNPDYYVWPCSGQDTMGMVRLFNAAQWAKARGLTCYDEAFASDLTHNESMRQAEWYTAYRSAAPNAEPPAPTPFVYAGLLPLVAGIEGAGPDLTLESFRAALDRFRPYRYDAVDGRTQDPTNMLLGLGTADRGMVTDAIALKYNPTRREPGSSAPGAYDFPEDRRYANRSDFAR